eukprot:TRINITY_DN1874_c0_g2_i3.p1 TRINITY_DN1874_c0_g2~~TRINITY_DN1874_c0_g2_i3.p1  ORF type:complete len:208 (-),score=62.20 TRINITY_DN1874_c0_g2_i3:99-722(-)
MGKKKISSGINAEYGKYCADGYNGCPGQMPCDRLDSCCQIHDWCVGTESMTSCECGNMLNNCIKTITDEEYNTAACPYMRDTAKRIMEETNAQMAIECLGKTFVPKCGPTINCNNVGTCNWNAGCSCGSGVGQFFQYDSLGRTNCKCQAGYYPLCGATATDLCKTKCTAQICHNAGVCSPLGECMCFKGYTGRFCETRDVSVSRLAP